MLRRLSGRALSGKVQKRTHIMPAMGRRTGKDGKRQVVKAILIIWVFVTLVLLIAPAMLIIDEINQLKQEMRRLSVQHKMILIKQLDTIQKTGDMQTKKMQIVMGAITDRIEQEKHVTNCYESIEQTTKFVLDHAKDVLEENERLRKENAVIAQAIHEVQEENRKFREGCKGDEI